MAAQPRGRCSGKENGGEISVFFMCSSPLRPSKNMLFVSPQSPHTPHLNPPQTYIGTGVVTAAGKNLGLVHTATLHGKDVAAHHALQELIQGTRRGDNEKEREEGKAGGGKKERKRWRDGRERCIKKGKGEGSKQECICVFSLPPFLTTITPLSSTHLNTAAWCFCILVVL